TVLWQVQAVNYSFFNVCIGLSALFSFMDPDKLKAYTDVSKLTSLLVEHQTLWFVAPLIVLAVMGTAHRQRYVDDY
ncbi:MAG: hypothetical protein AAB834_05500, partial [Patescibacteria group bacterium]